jgi:hypothetical protein
MAEVTGDALDNYELYLAPEKLREDAGRKTMDGKGAVLGPVYIHRVHSTAATRYIMAAKHLSVFS